MIRVVIFLLLVGVAALGAAWLADRPGDVTITWPWLGRHIDTSVMVLAAAMLTLIALSIVLWSILRALLRSPRVVARRRRERRVTRGLVAISRGLVAVGAGDAAAARRYAREAGRLAPADPLALLLTAQSAQMAGDPASAEAAFRAMVEREDTKLLGLHGLYIEAQRRDDAVVAKAAAEEAARTAPALGWAAQAVLEFRCAEHDWVGALAALERAMRAKLIPKSAYRRQRGVLLTARALALADQDKDSAKSLALEAATLAPDLVPAAALAGRFLAEEGNVRRAGRVIEAAWRANPHPDLAEAYADLRPGASARDRLARMQVLAKQANAHAEGALAVAQAALDAREFAIARDALAPLAERPTRRVATLMAELEELDTGDVGRGREWMARAINAAADPAWTADGVVSDHWMPVSPVTGRLDAFQWRVPLAELELEGVLIEERRARPAPVIVEAPPAPAPPPLPPDPAPEKSANAAPPPAPTPRTSPVRTKNVPRTVEPVIPLVHAPDDPGTEPEPSPSDPRGRMRQFFGG
jgi:HemY protein